VIAIVLAVVIEIIKRPAIDDVFKNLFQYKTLSKFALFVAFFVTAVSIDLSLRGAEKAPYIVIANPVYQAPTLALADPIRKEYEQREAALVTERERYRKQREWKGRIATKDANYIKELNRKIASTIASKDTALIQLKQDNEALIAEAKEKYKQEVIATNQKRQKYGNTLIWVQLIAEILYILFSIIEWAYSWEVMKESKIPAAIAAAAPQEDGSRTQKAGPAPPSDHQTAGTRTAAVPSGTADDPNKERRQIGFKQQQLPEIEVEHIKQIEFIEKEYTRICEHCGNGYVHKASNQKYCTTQCKKNAARLREAARKGQ
jgi:ABC-type multidrug transport system fused ATPase/permease subunit